MILQFMDLNYPLFVLRKLIEEKLNKSFKNYKFYLQENEELRDDLDLVKQGITGDGIVQFQLEIVEQDLKLNIIDVLKPADDYVDLMNFDGMDENAYLLHKWSINKNFTELQKQFRIPIDINLWSVANVRIWLKWFENEFKLNCILLNKLFCGLDGRRLLDIVLDRYKDELSDLALTHLKILTKYGIVATLKEPDEQLPTSVIEFISTFQTDNDKICEKESSTTSSNQPLSNHSSGHLQLWQFLIELLVDVDYRNIIEWSGVNGEFKFLDPDGVARLWGLRKNKPQMTFSTMSRALRYYYASGLIKKINKERYLYKFLFDIKDVIGYSVEELVNLMNAQ